MLKIAMTICVFAAAATSNSADAQAWRNCVPNSVGPGGCDSVGPGGGKSVGPGGGLSVGPGGGQSVGPGGGQSVGPNGGRSVGPGGGLSVTRDRRYGLNPNTGQPYKNDGSPE